MLPILVAALHCLPPLAGAVFVGKAGLAFGTLAGIVTASAAMDFAPMAASLAGVAAGFAAGLFIVLRGCCRSALAGRDAFASLAFIALGAAGTGLILHADGCSNGVALAASAAWPAAAAALRGIWLALAPAGRRLAAQAQAGQDEGNRPRT